MFVVPLSFSAHARARQRSRSQLAAQNLEKARQVYLDTLVASAVEYQLHCWGIATRSDCDGRDRPVLEAAFFELATVTLANGDRWDCRHLLPEATACSLPPATWREATGMAGHILAELAADLKVAKILGFCQQSAATLQRGQLQSLVDLPAAGVAASATHLGAWLEGARAAGWQDWEWLLETAVGVPSATATRGLEPFSTRQAKLLDLGMALGDRQAVLLVALVRDTTDARVSVRVRLLPGAGERCLPENLQLQMQDAAGGLLQGVNARAGDNFIQLRRFWGYPGDRFRLCIGLGKIQITEEFAF